MRTPSSTGSYDRGQLDSIELGTPKHYSTSHSIKPVAGGHDAHGHVEVRLTIKHLLD